MITPRQSPMLKGSLRRIRHRCKRFSSLTDGFMAGSKSRSGGSLRVAKHVLRAARARGLPTAGRPKRALGQDEHRKKMSEAKPKCETQASERRAGRPGRTSLAHPKCVAARQAASCRQSGGVAGERGGEQKKEAGAQATAARSSEHRRAGGYAPKSGVAREVRRQAAGSSVLRRAG